MGTDYGYGCRTCGMSHDIDNLREPEWLEKLLPSLHILEAVDQLNHELGGWPELYVGLQGTYYDYRECFQFALEHPRKCPGHVIGVFDEYGYAHPRCELKGSMTCRREHGHDGECRKSWKRY